MRQSFNQHRFLSVKWTLFFAIVLWVMCIIGVVASVTYHQWQNWKQNQFTEQRESLERELLHLTDQQITQVEKFSKQLLFILQQSNKEKITSSNLKQFLHIHWNEIQQNWHFEGIGLYNSNSIKINALGSEFTYSFQNKYLSFVEDGAFNNNSTVSSISCYEICHLLTAIPLKLNDTELILLVETKLNQLLANIEHNFISKRYSILLVSEQIKHQVRKDPQKLVWNKKYFAAKSKTAIDSQMSLPNLKTLDSRMDWQNINYSQHLYHVDNQSWLIWAVPFFTDINSPVLLVTQNIDEENAIFSKVSIDLIIIFLGIILSAGLLTGALCRKAILRIKKQSKLLPMLANKEFRQIRSELPKVKAKTINELDLLDKATLDLTTQLEKSQRQTDIHILELERLSMLDPLTNLPNNAVMKHELNKEIACVGRVHTQVALFFLDLDDFRRVNETWGYAEGDEFLKIVADRLTKSVRSLDTVFRYGGDEFLILLRGISDEFEVRYVAHKIFQALHEPITIKNHKLIVTACIGIALCSAPNLAAEEFIKYAELAMYHAKKAGRSNYRMFNFDMLAQVNNRMMIEQDISKALTDNQLSLFLQPIIELETGKLKGFEALIRWHHPELGLIMPGNFIPEIEDSEATVEVGNYVLKKGIKMIKRLQKIACENLYISVNISAKHWLSPGLKEYISDTLVHYDVSPQSLVLELTEESVIAIDQIEIAKNVFHSLKALGTRVAIDDFGTGYSSLNYLKNLPFDIVKIDRTFTQGVRENSVDPHIVSTMVDLAHNLELIVIAEGVETEEQVEFMKNAGCELCQGFLYSKPITEKQITEIIQNIKGSYIWPKA